jgi:hypothetical protein
VLVVLIVPVSLQIPTHVANWCFSVSLALNAILLLRLLFAMSRLGTNTRSGLSRQVYPKCHVASSSTYGPVCCSTHYSTHGPCLLLYPLLRSAAHLMAAYHPTGARSARAPDALGGASRATAGR